jgi:hypothetical protein
LFLYPTVRRAIAINAKSAMPGKAAYTPVVKLTGTTSAVSVIPGKPRSDASRWTNCI